MKKMIKQFALKWNMEEETVDSIYQVIKSLGGKYGKSHRTLKNLNINLSPRQLKYFYRKIRLTERYGTREEIGKTNYRNLVIKKS